MGRDKQKVGDVNELKATIKFLKEGYWVFRIVSPKGPIDMVIVNEKTGEVRLIDVKTTNYRQSWKPGTKIHRQRTPEQIKLKVEHVFMEKDDDV